MKPRKKKKYYEDKQAFLHRLSTIGVNEGEPRRRSESVEEDEIDPEEEKNRNFKPANKRDAHERPRIRCGAYSQETGRICQDWAMENGRCRRHGGAVENVTVGTHKERTGKATRRTQTHSLHARYLPEDIMEFIDPSLDLDPAAILWTNIQLQYATLIRLQKIMYVRDEEDHRTFRVSESAGKGGVSESREVHTAWDRYGKMVQAQTTAMRELRSAIQQFISLTPEEDERRLKISILQQNLEKLKREAETEQIEQENTFIINDKDEMQRIMEERMRKNGSS